MVNRFLLQFHALLQHIQLLGQAIDTLVHVFDACRGSFECALGYLDLPTDGGNDRLTLSDRLSRRIPVGLRQRQGIIALVDLILRLSQRSAGIVERSLCLCHRAVRLSDLLRITSCLRCGQLPLCGLKRSLILADSLILQLPLLGEHIHLRGQALH